MPNYPNPLNEQDYASLNELCKHCHGTAQMIADYKECGIPCEDHEFKNNAQQELAQNIKRKFFPLNP